MKEQKSNTAAFGGASFWKEISDWFSLFDLVLKSQHLRSYLHALVTTLYVCWLVSKS